ncbi:MAG: hypothetical protein JWQ52_1021, partial [Phenylobacterium sp.]|nr:hypothetical protein [Phenylobacterium sp.]
MKCTISIRSPSESAELPYADLGT